MSEDLKRFCEAMNGTWTVTRYSLEGDRLRVHYASDMVPGMDWSHLPNTGFETVPPVGAKGRICFSWEKTDG